jgi:hypothetical protein
MKPKQPRHRVPHFLHALDNVDLGSLPLGWHADGAGLWLRVRQTRVVSRRWTFIYQLDHVRHEVGLGGWPEVSLRAARRMVANFRNMLFEGRDPWEHRDLTRARRR